MTSLANWDPFIELRRMQQWVDQALPSMGTQPSNGAGELRAAPPIDIYMNKDEAIIEAAMPGVRPEDIEITLDGDTLRISGEVHESHRKSPGEDVQVLLKERRIARFERLLSLPAGLDGQKAKAAFADGMLILRIPRAERTKPKIIKVKSKK